MQKQGPLSIFEVTLKKIIKLTSEIRKTKKIGLNACILRTIILL